LIIICAKHGQSPIDHSKLHPIGNGQSATLIGASEAFDISDDGSLIWLTNTDLTPKVVCLLSEPDSQQTLGIQEIFAGPSLANKWDVPGTGPGEDPRTPGIILKVNTGVIFTGGSKIAEHGGINEDDLHTALLLSFPSFEPQTVRVAVSNQQVAPSSKHSEWTRLSSRLSNRRRFMSSRSFRCASTTIQFNKGSSPGT